MADDDLDDDWGGEWKPVIEVAALILAAIVGLVGWMIAIGAGPPPPEATGFVALLQRGMAHVPPWAWASIWMVILTGVFAIYNSRKHAKHLATLRRVREQYETRLEVRAWRILQGESTKLGEHEFPYSTTFLNAGKYMRGMSRQKIVELVAMETDSDQLFVDTCFRDLIVNTMTTGLFVADMNTDRYTVTDFGSEVLMVGRLERANAKKATANA